MTPAELRTMADEATKSGAWVVTLYGADKNGEHVVQHIALGSDDFIQTDGGYYGPNQKNARLIALAPDLARLCAELGEALEYADQFLAGYHDFSALTKSRVALVKLAELEVP